MAQELIETRTKSIHMHECRIRLYVRERQKRLALAQDTKNDDSETITL